MAPSLTRQRHLATIVRLSIATYGVEFRAEALGGIGDTMVVDLVVYFGITPFIAADTFTPSLYNFAAYTIIPFIGIDILDSFTSCPGPETAMFIQQTYKTILFFHNRH
jgi:hypothetical protein